MLRYFIRTKTAAEQIRALIAYCHQNHIRHVVLFSDNNWDMGWNLPTLDDARARVEVFKSIFPQLWQAVLHTSINMITTTGHRDFGRDERGSLFACYHLLLLFNSEEDRLVAKLGPGNVHSAEGGEEVLLPEIERQQKLGKEAAFRAHAAFARPEVCEALEERGVKYTIRIPANDSLERDIAELSPRPAGRPSQKPLIEYKGFLYQAASWKTARRVVARVEHHTGELSPRVGFIVTNLGLPSRDVVCYNKRGTAEQWIKEGKQVVKMTRLSCHRFRSNEVRRRLSVIAYNLWQWLVMPWRIENRRLTSLQQREVKTGGRLLKHARYYWLLLAERHLTRRLFGAMLRRIVLLPLPAG